MVRHYVLSTGRTGTVAIAHDINSRCVNGAAINEPHPRTPTRILGAMALDGKLPDRVKHVAWPIIEALRREPKSYLLVETNALVQGLADYLLARDRRSLLLHVVREPTDYIRSAVNFGSTPIKRLFAWHLPGWELSSTKHEALARMRDCGRSDVPSREALRYALHWRAVNGYLSALGRELGPRYRLLRFEDMIGSNQSQYIESLSWLGLEMARGNSGTVPVHNQGRRGLLRRYADLAEPVRTQICDICGPLAQEFGYSRP